MDSLGGLGAITFAIFDLATGPESIKIIDSKMCLQKSVKFIQNNMRFLREVVLNPLYFI